MAAIARICWNCDFFQAADPTIDTSGWCRRYPPKGIDFKSITLPVGPYDEFPAIVDATIEECGDFKTNAADIPPIP